jgi:hypothetical protein
MAKRPPRLAKHKTDLMPKNASCKRWDTPQIIQELLDLRALGIFLTCGKSLNAPEAIPVWQKSPYVLTLHPDCCFAA